VTEELIARIARTLDRKNVPYMVIGGQAVLIYGRARMTADIGITIGLPTGQVTNVLDVCRELELNVRTEDPEAFAAETMVLPAEDEGSKMMFDFIFSLTPYEQQALKRVNKVTLDGYPIRFASCEDIIVHKILAGRAVDIKDVRSILAKQGASLDTDYILKWLNEFEAMPEFAGVTKRFEELIGG
jgi:predicted nucleotidyltransferase